MKPSERFWSKVDVGKPDECWKWKNGTDDGYGRTYYQGKKWYAHRLSWFLTYGPIPEGLRVLHRCDTRACVNPGHLHLGTHAQNMKEMAERGRSTHGEKNESAKLTEEQVKEIRRLVAEAVLTRRAIAKLVGVTEGTVGKIVRGEKWQHVT